MCISIVFWDLFCKEKQPQNISMTSCDVVKLAVNWSRVEHARLTADGAMYGGEHLVGATREKA
jgi:hypothetical protein